MSRPPHKPKVLPDPELTELLGNERAEAEAAEPAPEPIAETAQEPIAETAQEPIAETAQEPIAETAPRRPLELFDSLGHVLKTLDESEVELLPDDQRAILMTTLAACRDAEACETKLGEVRKSINERMHAFNAALLAHEQGQPKITHKMALEAVISASDPKAPKPQKPRPANPKLKTALTSATDALAAVREELIQVEKSYTRLMRARGEAIRRWMECKPAITFESNVRAHIASEAAHKAGIADGTIDPPPEPEPRHVWPIEASMAARGKGQRKRTYFGATNVVRQR